MAIWFASLFITIVYSGCTKLSGQLHLGKLHSQSWTAPLAERTLKREEEARMLLIHFPILSTTISSSLPKPWILGKTLYSCPRMIISWLQLHRDLERQTYWFLVLFITNTWGRWSTKSMGLSEDNTLRMLHSVTWKKKCHRHQHHL